MNHHLSALAQTARNYNHNSNLNPNTIPVLNVSFPCAMSYMLHSVDRAFQLRSLERRREHVIHGGVVKQYPTKYCEVPDVVTTSKVVEPPRQENLGHFRSIYNCTKQVHCNTLYKWSIEIIAPGEAAGHAELEQRCEPGSAKRNIE